MDLDYRMIPAHCRQGLKDYFEHGYQPGSFLTSVLESNLVEAAMRADSTNIDRLRDYAQFLYNEAPRGSWGSPEKVNAWVSHHEQIRAADKEQA